VFVSLDELGKICLHLEFELPEAQNVVVLLLVGHCAVVCHKSDLALAQEEQVGREDVGHPESLCVAGHSLLVEGLDLVDVDCLEERVSVDELLVELLLHNALER